MPWIPNGSRQRLWRDRASSQDSVSVRRLCELVKDETGPLSRQRCDVLGAIGLPLFTLVH
jgi:hypothetical protein